MKNQEKYAPQWISAEDAARWLGVEVNTLIKWRSTKGLAWTSLGGRTIMYDRKQIESMLNENSTYAVTGEKQLA